MTGVQTCALPIYPLVAVPVIRKSSATAPTIHVTLVGWNRLVFESGFGSDTRVLSNSTPGCCLEYYSTRNGAIRGQFNQDSSKSWACGSRDFPRFGRLLTTRGLLHGGSSRCSKQRSRTRNHTTPGDATWAGSYTRHRIGVASMSESDANLAPSGARSRRSLGIRP